MPPRFTELVLRVSDVGAEARFWRDAIGLPQLRPADNATPDRIALFDMGGQRIEIHAGGTPLTPPDDRTAVSGAPIFLVDSVQAALDHALAAGARQLMDISDVPPSGRFVYVVSPGGQPAGFVEGDETAYRGMLGMKPHGEYWA